MNYILDKQYVVSENILKTVLKLGLNINEFMLILYFHNNEDKVFNLNIIKEKIGLDDKDILEAFNSLTTKNLINIDIKKDVEGHMSEKISINEFYDHVVLLMHEAEEEQVQENIFDLFEKEFNRKLTPMEYEIINAWLDNNTTEDIIKGALKEAIYNGVKSFRYIDKIIYEWSKKGLKTMEDVNNHLNNSYQAKEEKEVELFDYDWLDAND